MCVSEKKIYTDIEQNSYVHTHLHGWFCTSDKGKIKNYHNMILFLVEIQLREKILLRATEITDKSAFTYYKAAILLEKYL